MRYLAFLEVLLENKFKICSSKEEARQWLREQIGIEKCLMPFHPWEEKWAIFPFKKIIKEKKMP